MLVVQHVVSFETLFMAHHSKINQCPQVGLREMHFWRYKLFH